MFTDPTPQPQRQHRRTHRFWLCLGLCLALVLVACGDDSNADSPLPTTAAAVTNDGAVTDGANGGAETAADNAAGAPANGGDDAAVDPPAPTPTEPIALIVNGEVITLATFTAELAKFEQVQRSLGNVSDDYRAAALEMLIDRILINQAAAEMGIVVTPEMIDEKVAASRAAAEANGGAGTFELWLEANQMTLETYRDLLAYETVASLVAQEIVAEVPAAVPHVRARYIQVDDAALAQSLRDQLANGADFALLAAQYSLDQSTGQNGGDLGYFAEGTLLVPEVEAAAFQLAVNEISEVISVTNPDSGAVTYYIVQVLDIDPARVLQGNARHQVLQATYNNWLADLRALADIEILIDLAG